VKDPTTIFKNIKFAVREHHKLRASSLNLVASENLTSLSTREMIASDFVHRYSEWEGHDVSQRWGYGLEYTVTVEKILQRLIQDLYATKYTEMRPLSGQNAMLATLCGLLNPGDLVLSIRKENGGAWYRPNNLIRYKSDGLVFDPYDWNVDIDASAKVIKRKKPRALILGASFYIFPHPVAELRKIADDVGARIIYDGAHVLGLIAGGQWPNPLKRGADVLLGSTHKTIPGPQKGLILTRRASVRNQISDALYPSMIDNHHLMNSAALALALAELAKFGKAFAKAITQNAKSLATALASEGFDVVGEHKGFTQSHQVLVRLKGIQAHKAARLLESANIFANRMELIGAKGLRVGVTETTRIGMTRDDMSQIAVFLRRVLVDHGNPTRVVREVKSFVSDFPNVHFCFDRDSKAYAYPALAKQ
jgi:glycine hydroxymethyltransferase